MIITIFIVFFNGRPESLWGTDGKIPMVDGQKIGSWNADMESAPDV